LWHRDNIQAAAAGKGQATAGTAGTCLALDTRMGTWNYPGTDNWKDSEKSSISNLRPGKPASSRRKKLFLFILPWEG